MNRIKVRLDVDACGNVTLSAVNKRVAKKLGQDNVYDGSSSVFWQEAYAVGEDRYPVDVLPRSAFTGRGKDKDFNDGAVFLMDHWTFQQMVGGF